MTQVALITGAGRGLGQAIAERLLAAGFKVALTDRDSAVATATAKAIDPEGKSTMALGLDVSQKADFEAALTSVTEHWGQVQVLVNNAALTMTTPLMEITPEEYDQVVTVNQRGTFLGCQVFGARFAQQGYGRIINIASLAGQNGGTASGAHYASSKAAIITLTKIFARQLADNGVTVNAVAPGPLDLPVVRESVPEEKLQQIINDVIPVKTLGDPAYVADTVVHLVQPHAASVTGATWDINGGIFMR